MKLKEAIEILENTVKSNNEVIKEARKNVDINVMQLTVDLDNQSIAIETVLQALKNSIPKKKIEDMKEELEEIRDKYAKGKTNYINELQYAIDILKELLEDKKL